jgi:hypothetical protein
MKGQYKGGHGVRKGKVMTTPTHENAWGNNLYEMLGQERTNKRTQHLQLRNWTRHKNHYGFWWS